MFATIPIIQVLCSNDMVIKNIDFVLRQTWVGIPALLFGSSVTSDKLNNFSEPWFPHGKVG